MSDFRCRWFHLATRSPQEGQDCKPDHCHEHVRRNFRDSFQGVWWSTSYTKNGRNSIDLANVRQDHMHRPTEDDICITFFPFLISGRCTFPVQCGYHWAYWQFWNRLAVKNRPTVQFHCWDIPIHRRKQKAQTGSRLLE